jgi:two-component system nitrogen regulation response regulator GlnG
MVRLERYDAENLHAAIMERVERPLIKLVMERSKNNQLKASRILGINRNTLRTKLKKLDIER